MWSFTQTFNQLTFNVIFREIKEIFKQFRRRTDAWAKNSACFGISKAEEIGDDRFEIIQLNISLLCYGERFEFKTLMPKNEQAPARWNRPWISCVNAVQGPEEIFWSWYICHGITLTKCEPIRHSK